jgi:phospholipid/cholesterol/gamma-HCH transport system permease protein
MIVVSEPLLTAMPSGELLELRAQGSWTAANVAVLEALAAAAAPAIDRAKMIRLDLAGLSELDTLGAWLLEKLSRRAVSAGHRADVTGIAENYAGLIEEVRQVNRRNRLPPPARNLVVVKLEEIGPAPGLPIPARQRNLSS